MKLKIIKEAYYLLGLSDRKRGFVIVLLLVFQSLLDFFGLAFFLPLIFLIITPEHIAANYYVKGLYDLVGFSSPASFIVFITILVLAFTIVKNIIGVGITKAKAGYAFSVGANLSTQVMDWYVAKSYTEFAKVDFSKELTRIADYPVMFANNIILPLAVLLSESFLGVLIITGMAFYDYKILILLGLILMPVSLFYQYHKRNLEKTKMVLREKFPLSLKYVLQVAEGLVEIKVLGKESFFKERLHRVNQQLGRAFASDHVIQTSTIRITEVIAAFMICSIILYAVTTQQNHQQTILLLSIYASASFRMIPSVNRILNGLLQLRTHEFLIQDLKIIAHERTEHAPRTSVVIPFHEKIELRNISVRYPDGPIILQNMDMVIRKGEKIAITGRSGEGKTTLLLILLGLLKSTEGEIMVDGRKIQDEISLRTLLGYVPQNPYMLDGSLAENVAFGTPENEIDRSKILRLMEDLDLGTLLDQLPEGLDARIGERGVKLSGGQRQRLALARALYHDAEILLLDEVTNQLDQETEVEVMNALMSPASRHKTVILITHRSELWSAFDTCYELANGRLKKLLLDHELNRFIR